MDLVFAHNKTLKVWTKKLWNITILNKSLSPMPLGLYWVLTKSFTLLCLGFGQNIKHDLLLSHELRILVSDDDIVQEL